jgi:hypothetical protein
MLSFSSTLADVRRYANARRDMPFRRLTECRDPPFSSFAGQAESSLPIGQPTPHLVEVQDWDSEQRPITAIPVFNQS